MAFLFQGGRRKDGRFKSSKSLGNRSVNFSRGRSTRSLNYGGGTVRSDPYGRYGYEDGSVAPSLAPSAYTRGPGGRWGGPPQRSFGGSLPPGGPLPPMYEDDRFARPYHDLPPHSSSMPPQQYQRRGSFDTATMDDIMIRSGAYPNMGAMHRRGAGGGSADDLIGMLGRAKQSRRFGENETIEDMMEVMSNQSGGYSFRHRSENYRPAGNDLEVDFGRRQASDRGLEVDFQPQLDRFAPDQSSRMYYEEPMGKDPYPKVNIYEQAPPQQQPMYPQSQRFNSFDRGVVPPPPHPMNRPDLPGYSHRGPSPMGTPSIASNTPRRVLNYIPTLAEKPYYDALFREANMSGSIRSRDISADEVFEFLSLSRVPNDRLRVILTMANNERSARIDKDKFNVAVRLIQLYQNNQMVRNLNLTIDGDITIKPPFFYGISAVKVPLPNEDVEEEHRSSPKPKPKPILKNSSRRMNDEEEGGGFRYKDDNDEQYAPQQEQFPPNPPQQQQNQFPPQQFPQNQYPPQQQQQNNQFPPQQQQNQFPQQQFPQNQYPQQQPQQQNNQFPPQNNQYPPQQYAQNDQYAPPQQNNQFPPQQNDQDNNLHPTYDRAQQEQYDQPPQYSNPHQYPPQYNYPQQYNQDYPQEQYAPPQTNQEQFHYEQTNEEQSHEVESFTPDPQPSSRTSSPSALSYEGEKVQSQPKPIEEYNEDPYFISKTEIDRYQKIFPLYESQDREELNGPKHLFTFSKTDLEEWQIHLIWHMAVGDHITDTLDSIEFVVAIHLITCVTEKLLPIPTSLPSSLIKFKQTQTKKNENTKNDETQLEDLKNEVTKLKQELETVKDIKEQYTTMETNYTKAQTELNETKKKLQDALKIVEKYNTAEIEIGALRQELENTKMELETLQLEKHTFESMPAPASSQDTSQNSRYSQQNFSSPQHFEPTPQFEQPENDFEGFSRLSDDFQSARIPQQNNRVPTEPNENVYPPNNGTNNGYSFQPKEFRTQQESTFAQQHPSTNGPQQNGNEFRMPESNDHRNPPFVPQMNMNNGTGAKEFRMPESVGGDFDDIPDYYEGHHHQPTFNAPFMDRDVPL